MRDGSKIRAAYNARIAREPASPPRQREGGHALRTGSYLLRFLPKNAKTLFQPSIAGSTR